jgi:hypothetical protein
MPETLRHKVKWFHAGMSEFFRKEKLKSFREGDLWGLSITDVGGMVQLTCMLCGCNISNICILFAGYRYSGCVDSCVVEGT